MIPELDAAFDHRGGSGRGLCLTSASVPSAPTPGDSARDEQLAGAALFALVLLLPFEPRAALRLFGFGLTLLEAAAGLAALALAFSGRSRLLSLVRRPSPALIALGGYAVAHMLSAVLAPDQNARAAKFALRMMAMATLGVLVAAAPPGTRKRGLLALVVTTLLVAALALAEGLGVRGIDPVLDLFREMPFNVAGARRASAGSEYPNQAAAFLMCGLLTLTGLASVRSRAGVVAVALSAVLVAGLLFTYSRGALVAAGIGLVGQAVVLGRRGPRRAAIPLAALCVLIGGSLAFARTQEVFRLRVGSEGTEDWYRATYEPTEGSLDLRPGELRHTRVKVTNTGRKTWMSGPAFHLGYHWFDPTRGTMADGGRADFVDDVGPGASAVLDALIVAPRTEGRYLLVWDMVHEHTTWFSGQGVRAALVPTRVAAPGSAPLPPASGPARFDPSLGWKPSRGELWRLAAGMWAERPWTGFGSDSFRWTYGPRAGRPGDVRVFANDTLLEAGATTGTLGATALLLTLVMAGVSAGRGAAVAAWGSVELASSLALFGLVLGLAAHGVVDYVLAFTGHYLLFAFVVGACAALPREVR